MPDYIRISRAADSLRDIKITPHFLPHTDGSCLIECGNTKVICTASIDENVPPFLRGKNQGWVTAEYGMLPASTASRMLREGGQTVRAHTRNPTFDRAFPARGRGYGKTR